MAKQSLAAQAGVLKQDLALPAVFSQAPAKIEGKKWAPYVTFAHPNRKDEWAKISGKIGGAPTESDMFLIDGDNVVKLDQLKVSLLCARQMWVTSNPAGEVTDVSFTEKPGMKERVETAVLVYLEDRCFPANMTFKTTKCRAAKDLNDALEEAGSPAWADKSPAHRDSMVVGFPFGRYYGLIKVLDARKSKTSGMMYRPTSTVIVPTSTPEWRLLKAFSELPNYKEQMEAASSFFESRVEELKKKAR